MNWGFNAEEQNTRHSLKPQSKEMSFQARAERESCGRAVRIRELNYENLTQHFKGCIVQQTNKFKV